MPEFKTQNDLTLRPYICKSHEKQEDIQIPSPTYTVNLEITYIPPDRQYLKARNNKEF